MKTKKILLTALTTLFIAIFATSCEENENTIKDYDKDKLSITTYADDTEVKGGFSFTATEAWTTAIDYGDSVRSGSNDWVTLDPASGNAGEVTITITLDENLTGEDRNATIRIICGETTLTITIEQRSSENPNGDNTGTGDEPSTKQPQFTINSILVKIKDSDGDRNMLWNFEREGNNPRSTINRMTVNLSNADGSDSQMMEYKIRKEFDKLYIDAYYDNELYETIEANLNGPHIESVTYEETIAMANVDPNTGVSTETIYGIEKKTYNFYREDEEAIRGEGSVIVSTDYICENIFEGNEQYNSTNKRSYEFDWWHCDISERPYDIFNFPYNVLGISWETEYCKNIEKYTYTPNLNIGNVTNMIEPCAPGSFIDLNYFITTFWCEGSYHAYGGYNAILGLLGWITYPCYNFITHITTDDGYNQGGCDITYELNENNLIETVNIDDEIRLEIGYLEF